MLIFTTNKPKIYSRNRFYFFLLLCVFFSIFLNSCSNPSTQNQRINEYLNIQMNFGPRVPGSSASQKTAEYLKSILEKNGWQVEFQEFWFEKTLLRNVIAKKGDRSPFLIIGAHYDTRRFADKDEQISSRELPVPGAVDGASGVAVLLELSNNYQVYKDGTWLIFFDGEDQGNINGWPWSVGSSYFVHNLTASPKAALIIDMVGDKEMQIFFEKNSDQNLNLEIWKSAEGLGYKDYFIPQYKYALVDDHLPFINKGIPTSLVIDFDYPFWHTTADTIEKINIDNLEIISRVMHKWIKDFVN